MNKSEATKREYTDAQLVAYVRTWNSPPPGWPESHRLYYFDPAKGWTYLTEAGRAVEPDSDMLEEQEQRLAAWSRRAAAEILGGVEGWDGKAA